MADSTFLLDIVAQFTESNKNLEAFAKNINKTSSKIEKDFSAIGSGIKAAMGLAVAAAAALGVAFSLKSAIDEAAEFEQDVKQLTIALEATGQASQKSVDGFLDYAQALQETTKFSDNAVLSSAALIQNLAQLSGSELKTATKAALDLSSALGVDLNSASTLVAKAANGNVAAFKRYGIEIRAGRDDTETFANTLTVLQSRFGGASEKSVNTFEGALAQLRNAANDSLKTFGLLIIQNPNVIAAINAIASGFVSLTNVISNNSGAVTGFIDSVGRFIAKADGRQAVYDKIAASVKENTIVQRDLSNEIDKSIEGAKSFRVARIEAEKTAEITANKIKDQLTTTTDEALKKILELQKTAGLTEYQIISQSRQLQLKTIQDAEKLGISIAGGSVKARLGIEAEYEKKRKELNDKSNAYFAGEAEKTIKKQEELANKQKELYSQISGVVSSAISSLQQGAAGAAGALSSAAGMIADTLLPGIGGAVSSLLSFLAQGPEAVKAQIQAFIEQIPVVIQAIVESIPAVIDAFVESAPLLIQRLTELAPVIAFQLGISLQQQAPFIAQRFAFSLVEQTPSIALAFINSLVSQAGLFIQAIADGVKEAISKVTGGLAGGGGIVSKGVGVVKSIGKKFGFAEGGVIPGGFPNDSFPAQLTSGEGVVPNDTMQRLDRYLSSASGGQSSGGGTTIIKLVIGEQEMANVLLSLNQRGFRIS